ncbi:hypothetical protein MMPV_004568 [Pyropia vietnamensis]
MRSRRQRWGLSATSAAAAAVAAVAAAAAASIAAATAGPSPPPPDDVFLTGVAGRKAAPALPPRSTAATGTDTGVASALPACNVTIIAQGDDGFTLYADGVLASSSSHWAAVRTVTRWMSEGAVIAVVGVNLGTGPDDQAWVKVLAAAGVASRLPSGPAWRVSTAGPPPEAEVAGSSAAVGGATADKGGGAGGDTTTTAPAWTTREYDDTGWTAATVPVVWGPSDGPTRGPRGARPIWAATRAAAQRVYLRSPPLPEGFCSSSAGWEALNGRGEQPPDATVAGATNTPDGATGQGAEGGGRQDRGDAPGDDAHDPGAQGVVDEATGAGGSPSPAPLWGAGGGGGDVGGDSGRSNGDESNGANQRDTHGNAGSGAWKVAVGSAVAAMGLLVAVFALALWRSSLCGGPFYAKREWYLFPPTPDGAAALDAEERRRMGRGWRGGRGVELDNPSSAGASSKSGDGVLADYTDAGNADGAAVDV